MREGNFSFSASAPGVGGMEGDFPKVRFTSAREELTCLDLLSNHSSLPCWFEQFTCLGSHLL